MADPCREAQLKRPQDLYVLDDLTKADTSCAAKR